MKKHEGFTPGPWVACKKYNREFVIKADGAKVAYVQLRATSHIINYANEVSQANARLIADAPNLLAENERLKEELLNLSATHAHRGDVSDIRKELINEQQSLIHELTEAVEGVLDIGKRNMENPKYDGYFNTCKEAIKKAKEFQQSKQK